MRISDWSSDVCSSDLDARFHRGGDAQQIDVVGESDLVADRNVLEQALAVARKHLVRLTRHLSAVETEDRAGIDREPAVVIDLRSEERRVGKECVSPCRSWGAPYH